MGRAGIRFNNNEYVNISIDGETIDIYVIDKNGNKIEYTATKKTTKKTTKK